MATLSSLFPFSTYCNKYSSPLFLNLYFVLYETESCCSADENDNITNNNNELSDPSVSSSTLLFYQVFGLVDLCCEIRRATYKQAWFSQILSHLKDLKQAEKLVICERRWKVTFIWMI